MSPDEFRIDFYTEPENFEESPYLDRKAYLDIWQESGKAELIRDLISLANSARIYGKCAYLILGLDDNGHVVGVQPMLDHFSHEKDKEKKYDWIKTHVSNLIRDYIDPPVIFEFKHSNFEEKEIAYLQIQPVNQEFKVKKDFIPKNGIEQLHIGQKWIRTGANKIEEIYAGQKPYCYSFTEVPFIRITSRWIEYYESILSNFAKRPSADPYINPTLPNGENFFDAIDEMLDSDKSILVIEGVAGGGKTEFIAQYCKKHLENGLEILRKALKDEEAIYPRSWIPIFKSLKSFRERDKNQILKSLANSLNRTGSFWEHRPATPEKIFEYSEIKWLLIFDGLDENPNSDSRESFVSALSSICDDYSNIKIIVTMRPGTMYGTGTYSPKFISMTINEWNINQIASYFAANLDQGTYKEVLSYVNSYPDFQKICSIPLYANVVSSYFGSPKSAIEKQSLSKTNLHPELNNYLTDSFTGDLLPQPINADDLILNEAIPKLDDNFPRIQESTKSDDFPADEALSICSIFHQTYQRFFEREIDRSNLTIMMKNELISKVGRLAFVTDGKYPKFSWNYLNKYLKRKKIISWCLNSNIILDNSSYLSFFTENTKLYFAALELKPQVEIGNQDIVERELSGTSESFRLNVKEYLSVLTNQIYI